MAVNDVGTGTGMAAIQPIFFSLSSKMYFSEKVRLSSTSLSLMKLVGALNSLLVTVTQLHLITLCLFKSKTSVAEAC